MNDFNGVQDPESLHIRSGADSSGPFSVMEGAVVGREGTESVLVPVEDFRGLSGA